MADLLKIATAIKDYGIMKILRAITLVAWIILPFLVWRNLYTYFGPEQFSFSLWVILGLIMSLFILGLSSIGFFQRTLLSWKMMKNVETAKEVFENPTDPQSEAEFRKECQKFMIPYLHYKHFYEAGARAYLTQYGFLGTIVLHVLLLVVFCFTGYSLFILFLEIHQLVNPTLAQIAGISYFNGFSQVLTDFVGIILQYPIISMIIIFIMGLPLVIDTREKFRAPLMVADELFSLLTRVAFLGAYIVSTPITISKRDRTLKYKPFTFPQPLPELIQTSIMNIENKVSYVTKFTYEGKTEDDVKKLKDDIVSHKDIPNFIRNYCKIADCDIALKNIVDSKPVLFLGLIDNRCAFMGKISYDVKEKIYRAKFYFDNKYLRNEFKDIAKIQIEEQKRLKREYNIRLLEVLNMLAGEKQ